MKKIFVIGIVFLVSVLLAMPLVSADECIDSDGGKVYDVRGSYSICDSEGNCSLPTVCDTCLDDHALKECYCVGAEIMSEIYVCPYGCSYGACLAEPSDCGEDVECESERKEYCIDSDACYSETDYNCVDGKCVASATSTGACKYCEDGCKDGACVGEICPVIIGWRIVNNKCISDSGCRYDSSTYDYYNSPNECEEQLVFTECGEGTGIVCSSRQEIVCEGDNECIKTIEYKCIDDKCVNVGEGSECTFCEHGCENRFCLTLPDAPCNGCLLEDDLTTCLPLGTRQEGGYCTIDKEFAEQKTDGQYCDNNWECRSNLCTGDECVSLNLIQKIIAFFKNLFGG